MSKRASRRGSADGCFPDYTRVKFFVERKRYKRLHFAIRSKWIDREAIFDEFQFWHAMLVPASDYFQWLVVESGLLARSDIVEECRNELRKHAVRYKRKVNIVFED